MSSNLNIYTFLSYIHVVLKVISVFIKSILIFKQFFVVDVFIFLNEIFLYWGKACLNAQGCNPVKAFFKNKTRTLQVFLHRRSCNLKEVIYKSAQRALNLQDEICQYQQWWMMLISLFRWRAFGLLQLWLMC